MEGHQNEIYLINDESDIKEFGPFAYFIEEGLFKKVVKNLENAPATINLDIG